MIPPNLVSLYPGPAPVISHLGPYSALALPNYWRRFLSGKWPIFQVAAYSLNPGQSGKLTVNQPPHSWMVSIRATVSAPGGLRFQILDPLRNLALSQRPFDSRCGAGTGQRPFVLTRPYYVRQTTPLLIKVSNQDMANSNKGQLCFECYYDAP